MIQELDKPDINRQQAVFERLIQVNYSRFNSQFSFLRDNFWR